MSGNSGKATHGAHASPLGKGRIVIVAGAPASGKGTQCKRLADEHGFVHVSTGDIFRDIAARGTELGTRAKEFVDKGCFVPDDMVLSLVQERLSQPDVKERGCLLDGFPRTADQAEALLQLVKVDAVLWLRASDKVLIGRAAGRRVHPETGNIYHLTHMAPPPEIMDHLVRRDRDDERSFRQRLEVFRCHHRRVLPFFSGLVHTIDATLEPDDVFNSIVRTLEGIFSKSDSRQADGTSMSLLQQSCAICFEEPANFLVVPCGHQCGCEECLTTVHRHSGRCPICRVPVESIQRVFVCGHSSDEKADATTIATLASAQGTTHPDFQDKLDKQAGVVDEDDWSDDGDGELPSEQPDGVSLVVAPCQDVHPEGGEVPVMISAQIPDAIERAPADVVCVIDVSGSMGTAATYEGEDGKKRDDGLSILDIVKHAVKTVIKALQERDRLAIVSFNNKASTVLSLTSMNIDGQRKALEALDSLKEQGQTNIWAGILDAMDALRDGSAKDHAANLTRQQAILLLTDGQPNVTPPKGHVTEMRNYKDTHPGFTFQLNTFGFGYNLNSELLLELATEGNGTYAFIPDAVIVGTTFVNSVANVLSTLSQSATLSLMPRAGAELAGPVLGGFAELSESWGRVVSLGPLQHGQSRELVVPVRFPSNCPEKGVAAYLDVVLTYPKASGSCGRVTLEATSRTKSADAVLAACRADVVSTGYAALAKALGNQDEQAGADVSKLNERLAGAISEASRCTDQGQDEVNGWLLALKTDVDGRMSKALMGMDRFNRWGKHYLRALMRSHQVQLCTNFMDPGLQPYGGTLFRSLRKIGDEIFLSLPPPEKKKPLRAAARKTRQAATPPSPQMNTYYAGAGGGCFAPSSSVQLVVARRADVGAEIREEVRQVPVRSVQAGDLLRVAGGGTAQVRCVVEIAREEHKSLVTLPHGLRITPRHPVRVDGEWQLPCNLPGASISPCTEGSVFNVVLDRCHVLLVDEVECVTWGHGLRGDVVGHPFFGTGRVVEELATFEGWEKGFVRLQGTLRDALSGEVVGFTGARLDTDIASGALLGDLERASCHLASNL